MKKYERVKALVSLDAIAHNFEEMHKNVDFLFIFWAVCIKI